MSEGVWGIFWVSGGEIWVSWALFWVGEWENILGKWGWVRVGGDV